MTAVSGRSEAQARTNIALVASILGSGIVFLDGTIVNVALPAIRSRACTAGSRSSNGWSRRTC